MHRRPIQAVGGTLPKDMLILLVRSSNSWSRGAAESLLAAQTWGTCSRLAAVGKGGSIKGEVMAMHNSAAILLSAILIACLGYRAGADGAANTDPPTLAPKSEWKLPSGLMLSRRSVDISFDRRQAAVCGQRVLGKASAESCWLVNLETAEIEDLLSKCEEKAARILRDPKDARFSPNGKHLLITANGEKSACVLDLGTRKSVVVSVGENGTIMWFGNRLLIGGLTGCEIRDVAGNLLEKKALSGVIASDPAGRKLLVQFSDPPMVVSPEATVLREFGGTACDREAPQLSRSGNWAGAFCEGKDGWAYSVVSTTTDKVYRLRRPWGATFALTDNGDSIFWSEDERAFFGAVITGGHDPKLTTAAVVFWPKEDDPWKSTKGAPAGPSTNDLIWNAMPKGKSEIIAKKAMALTLLGNELFFVQATGDERFLKAVALPEKQASSPAGKSRRSQNTR